MERFRKIIHRIERGLEIPAPEAIMLDVDPSSVRAEKAIEDALRKLHLAVVKTEKIYSGTATRMYFHME